MEYYTLTIGDIFLDALELLHNTRCADVRDRVFAALSNPKLAAKEEMEDLRPNYLLSRNELLVIVIAYFDRLTNPDWWRLDVPKLSRTLSRSLSLGDGTNTTDAYISDVTTSILSCTREWSNSESLFLKSGIEIGRPGPYLKGFLVNAEANTKTDDA